MTSAFAARPGAVRYVRHKPGKALFIMYAVADRATCEPGSMLCLSVDESVAGPASARDIPAFVHVLEDAARGLQSAVARQGVQVHHLPDDPELPALRAAWSPQPGDAVCAALETMLSEREGLRATIVGVTAIPRHYKPGSRCVIEYRLVLQQPGAATACSRIVFGKLVAKAPKAHELDAALRRVEAACDPEGPFAAWAPRSLGVLEALGMCVADAATQDEGSRSGLDVLRPERNTLAGRAPIIPADALDLAAGALARLHTSSISVAGLDARTAAYESERAIERGTLLARYHSGMEDEIRDVATLTAESLAQQQSAVIRPCHGSFKRSQLVYTAASTLTVTDWDSMCAADPALDLGCFVAHLRPSAVWYARPGARAWFTAAAAHWTQAYVREMVARGVPHDVVAGVVGRSSAYEAATLLKMATRRLRRLNSPRPQELRSILDEAGRCLTADAAA